MQFSQGPYDFQEGAMLLVDKPLEWTSFDVVNKLRYAIKRKLSVKKIKVGHAGTLDPMATGLLIICTGKMTKQIDSYQGLPKEYIGELKLGATTPSYDSECEEDQQFPIDHIDDDLLSKTARSFIGIQEQKAPIYSARKVAGKALYHYARKGQEVEIKAREIEISSFDITRIKIPHVQFKVTCSKGTYIRSLAHDYGKAMESGAYLTALCRTAIGNYQLEDAWNLEELVSYIDAS